MSGKPGLLSRLDRWARPELPAVAAPEKANGHASLDAAAAAAIQRFASISSAIAPYQVGKPLWPDRDPAAYHLYYTIIPLVFRCLNLIGHAIGTAPLKVYDEATDDEEVKDHGLRRLMRQPNAQMGEAIFWGTIGLRAGLAGFCVCEKEKDRLGNVIALNPLRSSWLKAIPIGRGAYDWEYRIPGTPTVYRLAAANVVPFRWADTPDGSPYGQPPMASAARSATVLSKLTDFLAILIDRGGVPLHGLIPNTLPGQALNQEQVDEMVERFVRRHGGIEQSAIPMVLEGIKDVKRLGFDLDELAYTDLRDVTDLEICAAFGVPPHKAITRVGLEHVTENATAAVEDGTFYRDTIVPLWTRFDDVATTGLLPDFEPMPTTRYLGFDKSDIEALQEDRNEKARAIVIPGFGGGLLSNHMALRELGMPIPDGLPEYYLRSIAVEAIPADALLAPPTPTTTTTPPPQLGRVTVRELTAGTGPSEAFAKRKAIGAANRKAHVAVADARKPSLAAFFQGQGERVIRGIDGTLSSFHLAPAIRLASLDESFWQHEDDLLRAVLEKLYLLAGQTSWEQAAEHLGVDLSFDLANPRVRSVMAQLAKRVTGVNDTSRQLIAEAVTKNAEAGGSTEDLKGSLKEMFGSWPDYRAEAAARTESAYSYGLASHASYVESGVVDRIQMFDNGSHTTDPMGPTGTTCADRDGRIAPLSETNAYLDSMHVNCVMAIAPVIAGEE